VTQWSGPMSAMALTDLPHTVTHLVALLQLLFGKKSAVIYPRVITLFNEVVALVLLFFNCSY